MHGNDTGSATGTDHAPASFLGRVLDTKIRALTIDLTIYTISVREVLEGLRDRYTVGFFAVLTAYMVLAHPDKTLASRPVFELVVIFVIALLYVISVVVAACMAAAWLRRRWHRLVLPVPLVVAASVISVDFLAAYVNWWLWGLPIEGQIGPHETLLERAALQYVYSLVHEVVLFFFIVPRTKVYRKIEKVKLRPKLRFYGIRVSNSATGDPPDTQRDLAEEPVIAAGMAPDLSSTPSPAGLPESSPTPANIKVTLGRKTTTANKVLAIIAEEHYMRVIYDDCEDLIYAQMGRLVEELPPDVGMRIHRSFWVNYSAIVRTSALTRGRLMVELSNGRKLQVSKSHRDDFLAALQSQHGSHDWKG